jgi:hypothetical protein
MSAARHVLCIENIAPTVDQSYGASFKFFKPPHSFASAKSFRSHLFTRSDGIYRAPAFKNSIRDNLPTFNVPSRCPLNQSWQMALASCVPGPGAIFTKWQHSELSKQSVHSRKMPISLSPPKCRLSTFLLVLLLFKSRVTALEQQT